VGFPNKSRERSSCCSKSSEDNSGSNPGPHYRESPSDSSDSTNSSAQAARTTEAITVATEATTVPDIPTTQATTPKELTTVPVTAAPEVPTTPATTAPEIITTAAPITQEVATPEPPTNSVTEKPTHHTQYCFFFDVTKIVPELKALSTLQNSDHLPNNIFNYGYGIRRDGHSPILMSPFAARPFQGRKDRINALHTILDKHETKWNHCQEALDAIYESKANNNSGLVATTLNGVKNALKNVITNVKSNGVFDLADGSIAFASREHDPTYWLSLYKEQLGSA